MKRVDASRRCGLLPPGAPTDVMIETSVSSETGACRRVNEDRAFADSSKGIIAVFDGAFREGAGADVALACTQALTAEQIARGEVTLRSLAHGIDSEIRKTTDPALGPCATTLLVATVLGRVARVAHVGDGRAYLLRDGSLRQLSTDHTLVAELMATGSLSTAEADQAPNSGVITRALGFGANAEPDVFEVETQPGDIVVLCTDGVWRWVDEAQMKAALLGGPFVGAAARVTELSASPGRDNSTVAAVRFTG